MEFIDLSAFLCGFTRLDLRDLPGVSSMDGDKIKYVKSERKAEVRNALRREKKKRRSLISSMNRDHCHTRSVWQVLEH